MIASLALLLAALMAPCPVQHREIVRIRGLADTLDPYLWVTGPDRIAGDRALRDYQNGLGDFGFVYFHTRLLDRDTKAIVTAACPGGDRRVVGVRILSGLHKDAFGFVDARDVI